MLVLGDFNATVGTYQNVKVDNYAMVSYFMLHSKDCIMSNYGRLLIHMLKCTNLHILNATDAFLMTNVLTCL